MDEKLYDLCDWAEIEAIVYSEHDNPHHILGAHVTDDGILFNTFCPDAVSATVNIAGKKYDMELADEEGFFAALVPGKKIPKYTFTVKWVDEEGKETVKNIIDPYSFEPVMEPDQISRFNDGINYDVYNILGSHLMTVNGVKGTYFAVWAPNVMRVSLVGDFNNWDGRIHQMRRLGDSGIHEIFVPGVEAGAKYKYELKIRGDLTVMKSDPYANQFEKLPADASVVTDINSFKWNDAEWNKKVAATDSDAVPTSIYEVHLGTWKRNEENEVLSYKEIAPLLAEYVKEMGYTHVLLLPIMEYMSDQSAGYDVTGYYAPTSRYGLATDFMFFINYMHENNIGVLIDWTPESFAADDRGLYKYDGTCLYEHEDPKKGVHPQFGTRLFNFGRPQVSNFLIANAMFWAEKYHVDGIRINSLGTMLYLDYMRKPGQWIPNMYGSNEHLEGIEFIKHLNSMMSKKFPQVMIIANDEVKFDDMTTPVDDGGLGFTYKVNTDFGSDMKEYLECDPLFRKGRHNQLTFGMVYAYSEKFMLSLDHSLVSGGNTSLISRMPGEYYQKFSNFKAALAYSAVHPGKKLIFMGQDMGQYNEWNPDTAIDWNCLNYDNHIQINTMVKKLNELYKNQPALHKLDYDSDGFEWINDMDADRSVISFVRKTDDKKEALLVVCNFTPVVYENYLMGVPYKARYKEIFNSDDVIYGGAGNVNAKIKNARKSEVDGREFCINVTVPPLGVTVFNCSPIEPSKKEEEEEKSEQKTVAKAIAAKTTAEKTTVKKEAVKKETAKKEAAKKETVKKEPAKKAAVKKETVKKESVKKATVNKPETKKEVKTETAKAAEVKSAAEVKKAEDKKEEIKKEVKNEPVKTTKKA